MTAARLYCFCSSYLFQHRPGLGTCKVTPPGDSQVLEPLCGACGQPADGHDEDWGVGETEAWGVRAADTNWVFVSDCCGVEFAENSAEGKRDAAWVE